MCIVCIVSGMRHNVYIRKEDEMLWDGIIDIPSFIHEALVSQNKPLLRPQTLVENCPHGYAKGMCKTVIGNIDDKFAKW